VADGVDPLNPSESKDDLVFDLHPNLPEQLAEYKYVEGQFKKNKLTYDDRMLKKAVIYDNTLGEEGEKKGVTQGQRYPDISTMLFHNPFHVPKKAGKKKKKKKKWSWEYYIISNKILF